MPKKPSEEKLTGKMLLSVGPELERELRDVAKANNVAAPQQLLLEAARAIVRHQQQYDCVPKDIEIRQRPMSPAERTDVEAIAKRWMDQGAIGPLIIKRDLSGSVIAIIDTDSATQSFMLNESHAPLEASLSQAIETLPEQNDSKSQKTNPTHAHGAHSSNRPKSAPTPRR